MTATDAAIDEKKNEDSSMLDELSIRLRNEALDVEECEPELKTLLRRTVLEENVVTFEDAVTTAVCYRMLNVPCSRSSGIHQTTTSSSSRPMFCPNSLHSIIADAMASTDLELGHTMSDAVRQDALAVCARDPATETLLEVVLFYKGFAALVAHRAARRLWFRNEKKGRSFTSLFLQSQASAVFGVDIHPAAALGAGLLFDHATGVVIGETAVVGDGCTMLHGVTLGGTGKEHGDRHPKIGHSVLIGAGASVLGNVRVGDGAKIGAGSIVLRPIPSGATAVGAPAKIIGRAKESEPGSTVDELLEGVMPLHKTVHPHHVKNNKGIFANPPKSMPLVSSQSSLASTASETESDETTEEPESRMCPFRELTHLAKDAPPGSVTMCTLKNMLLPEGATIAEIGEVYFALDTELIGSVPMEVLKLKFLENVTRFTRIPPESCLRLLSALEEKRQIDRNKERPHPIPVM